MVTIWPPKEKRKAINTILPKEILDITCDFAVVEFQGKVATVYKLQDGVGKVTFECLDSGGNEGRIILATDRQEFGV